MKVEFINLRQAGLAINEALFRLAARHWREGRRMVVLAQDQPQAQEVDRLLWTFDPASFIPHALAGGPDQAQEPILVATDAANLNQAQVLIMLAACQPSTDHLADYDHLIDFVPAEPGRELDAARERYRRWQETLGVELTHTTSLPA